MIRYLLTSRGNVRLDGLLLDEQTRCVHYHSPVDVIAIRFKCCDVFYPCFECHQALADHAAIPWSKDEFEEKAVLCGVCKTVLSIHTYLNTCHKCPACGASFNPRCSVHHHLYFSL
jgi:uncharacterized CHY-type Zn-finger protein